MSTVASQISSLTIIYSTVHSGADQRKHQSSASLAFVRGIHRSPVNSPHKWPVTQKMFPFDDVIMCLSHTNLLHTCLGWRFSKCGYHTLRDVPIIMAFCGSVTLVKNTFKTSLSSDYFNLNRFIACNYLTLWTKSVLKYWINIVVNMWYIWNIVFFQFRFRLDAFAYDSWSLDSKQDPLSTCCLWSHDNGCRCYMC